MKTKKAIKRLRKAQLLLSSVIEQYAGGKSVAGTRDLLRVAVDSIDQAQTSLEECRTATIAEAGKSGGRTKKQGRTLSEESRRRLSLAAKKRWAVAKRKGLRTLAVA
jgi:hypothetical protein